MEKISFINNFQNFAQHKQLIIPKDSSFDTFSSLPAKQVLSPPWNKPCGHAVNRGLQNSSESQLELSGAFCSASRCRAWKIFLVNCGVFPFQGNETQELQQLQLACAL